MLPLRIAQIAPLLDSVPPKFANVAHNSIERAVAYLTDELVRLGHEVTLFANGNSRTLANLVKCSAQGEFAEALELEKVFRLAAKFDMLHFHIPPHHFPLLRRSRIPAVTTLYGQLDSPGLQTYFNEFSEMPVVSLSDSQRRSLKAKWIGSIPIGIPTTFFQPVPFRAFSSIIKERGGYLAFSSQIAPGSRVDRAIEIARQSGKSIKIVSSIEPEHRDYFDSKIAHLMQLPFVEFKPASDWGDDRALNGLLANADALLITSDQSEPFYLNAVEALACGTPVIAFGNRSVEEVLVDGLSGYIVDSLELAVLRVGQLDLIDRRQCRKVFEARFTATHSAQRYIEFYEREIAASRGCHGQSDLRNLPSPEDQLWS